MYEELAEPTKRVVGIKQVCRAIDAGELKKVFIAADADEEIKNSLLEEVKKAGIEYEMVRAKKKLGTLCKISVSAACAGILK